MDARTAVMAQLETAYERLAVQEQMLRTTDPEGANVCHDAAVRVLRARLAEDDDPKVPTLPIHCLNCAAAYAAGMP